MTRKTVPNRRYLTDDELKKVSGSKNPANPKESVQNGRKYLSVEELSGAAKPVVDESPKANLNNTSIVGMIPTKTIEKKSEPVALAPVVETSAPSSPVEHQHTMAKRPSASTLSPMSDGCLSYLQSKLPERINNLDDAQVREAIEKLKNGASYTIGPQLARGAESLLYQSNSNGYNFLVKAIRNWRDHWIGDVRTRKDIGKLNDNVLYTTKLRHLNNEWNMGQVLQNGAPNPIPVQFYSLRKVTKLGIELGWDLLMERINGIDLSDKKLLTCMTLADKIRVCIRMAQAIGFFHQKRMIHLDIKPSNFMLDRTGNIRLIDFGISVPTGYQSRTVAGTAGYFSPEQISCRELGEDTDIFALGVCFNVIFGGRTLLQTPDEAKSRQFRHNAATDLEKNSLSAVTEIPELNGQETKPMAEVIRACTIFRRDKRIANCAQLVTQLLQAAANCGIAL